MYPPISKNLLPFTFYLLKPPYAFIGMQSIRNAMSGTELAVYSRLVIRIPGNCAWKSANS